MDATNAGSLNWLSISASRRLSMVPTPNFAPKCSWTSWTILAPSPQRGQTNTALTGTPLGGSQSSQTAVPSAGTPVLFVAGLAAVTIGTAAERIQAVKRIWHVGCFMAISFGIVDL